VIRWLVIANMMFLIPAKNSPGFAAGEHYMLHTLDRLHVLRALEG
jgi:hypothetical protein